MSEPICTYCQRPARDHDFKIACNHAALVAAAREVVRAIEVRDDGWVQVGGYGYIMVQQERGLVPAIRALAALLPEGK